jgi:hypothetical protein
VLGDADVVHLFISIVPEKTDSAGRTAPPHLNLEVELLSPPDAPLDVRRLLQYKTKGLLCAHVASICRLLKGSMPQEEAGYKKKRAVKTSKL